MIRDGRNMIYFVLSALLLIGWLELCYCKFNREMVCSLALYPTPNEMDWDCPSQYSYYLETGLYSPREMMPTRFQTHEETTFLAFPRYRCGVAATLVSVHMDDYCKVDPVMTPFPSWQMNNATPEWTLANVVDLHLDDNNILWALDIGVLYTLSCQPEVISPPRVFGFCPKTGKVIARIPLGGLVCKQSRLQHVQAEVAEDGKTFVYVSDAGTASILVWDVDQQTGYKVVLPPDVTDYPLCKDVLYLALIRKEAGNFLYFTYLMGRKMYTIRTCSIRYGQLEGAVMVAGCKPGPMVVLGTDGGQTMYLRMRQEAEIFMWNTGKVFRPRSLVLVQRSRIPRYPTHVAPGYRRLMWTLGSNFPDYFVDQQGSLGVLPKLEPLVKFCDSTP